MTFGSAYLDLVVLAGGRGTRLGGVVKPLLRHGPHTLLEAAVSALPGEVIWVVSPRPLRGALEPVLAEIRGRSVQWLEDGGQGPARAVLSAARVSRAQRLLVVAGDHVSPRAELAQLLIEAGRDREGAWVVRPDGHPEPLFSVLDRARLLFKAREDPPAAARRLFARLDLAPVPIEALSPEARAGLVDVDTPEDAARHEVDLDAAPFWPPQS